MSEFPNSFEEAFARRQAPGEDHPGQDNTVYPFQLAYTVDEACRQLGIKRTTLYLAISNRYLDARKIGARTVITGESLLRWLASRPRAEIKCKSRTKAKTRSGEEALALPKPSTDKRPAGSSKRGRS